MTARLTFLAIAAFWLTMNGLLWRAEFGAHAGDTPVPAPLVWQKILTTPDASSLSVYRNGERMGYCEVSTGVGQQMARFDDDQPPPEGIVAGAGYKIRLAGNIALNDFTNRLKFDARVQFNRLRQWEEISFRISSRQGAVEIHSRAADQTAHVKVSNGDALLLEHEFAFSDLQNPAGLLRTLTGNAGDGLLGALDWSLILPATGGQNIEWDARRTRVKIGSEKVPVYELETTVLGHPVTVDVGTLGEILCVKLPGNIVAHIDEWGKP